MFDSSVSQTVSLCLDVLQVKQSLAVLVEVTVGLSLSVVISIQFVYSMSIIYQSEIVRVCIFMQVTTQSLLRGITHYSVVNREERF